jgi:hypothetical protein
MMIDDELRQMFTEREACAPDADRTTGRILRGIPARRRRHRRRQAVTVLGVLAATLTVPLLLEEKDPPRQEALVAASDPAVTLPVTPKWLPEAAVTRTFADAVLSEGMRAISYEFGGVGGILAVQVHTSTRPPARESPGAGSSEPRVAVRGQSAVESESIDASRQEQSCTLAWQDRAQLWLTVFVRAEGVTPGVACTPARQVAQGLVDRPLELDRPIRFGLVPRDYVLVQAGTNVEAWCPRAGDNQHTPRCVQARDAAHTLAANGRQVTVRGHAGWLNRTATEVSLVVPGYVELRTATPAVDPAVAALTDDDLIRLAESVSLARGW